MTDSSQTPAGSAGTGADAIAWSPDPELMAGCNLQVFLRAHGLADFDELMARSTQDVAWFTDAVLRFLDIRFASGYDRAVDLSAGIAFPRWCPGGRMNITTSCLDRWLAGADTSARTALVAETEAGQVRQLTYAQLAEAVGRCANALRQLGVGPGDRVGLFMPMVPEIAVALLAIVRIGAVVLPLFSGFGAGAVAARLADAEVRALITADGTVRRGTAVPLKAVADQALAGAPTVRSVLVLRNTGAAVAMQPGRDRWWHELVDGQDPEAPAADTDAEDRAMIIYTSGTTGRPKGAVHTHCGFPVKAAQDMCFGLDVRPGELVYWVTDMGWMMGPWLVFGTSLLGAACFLYEGAPDQPDPGRTWAMAARHRIARLGLSPTLVRSLKSHGDKHLQGHDLSGLRAFGSTGEPWNPEPWRWLFDVVGGGRIPIVNYSGGTEISGGILMDNPLRPGKPAAFSAPCPGLDVDVVDAGGRSLRGQVGELVIRTPWIGMTRGFWRDPDGVRYLETYWSRLPDVWVHGDWALVDDEGFWWILGRSDDTINVAGKRVGPAEFESILVDHPQVVEAGVVGVPHDIKGSDVVCFCVLACEPDDPVALARELSDRLASELGRPLRPGRVLFVADLPRTRSAKVMRRILRAAYLGEDPGDTSSLANPDSVAAVAAVAAARGA